MTREAPKCPDCGADLVYQFEHPTEPEVDYPDGSYEATCTNCQCRFKTDPEMLTATKVEKV